MGSADPVHSFHRWLRRQLGGPARRISLDPGFGCPTRADGPCVFCRPESYRPGWQEPGAPLSEQLQEGLRRLRRRSGRAGAIAYLQAGTATLAPVERLQEVLTEITAPEEVCAVAVGTRPDCLPPPVVELLARWSRRLLLWVEPGVQTVHDRTLLALGRGHTWEQSREGILRLRSAGVLWAPHLILGLPGEGPAEERRTAEEIGRLEPCGFKLHHLQVVRGTPLADWWRRGRVRPLGVEEYAHRAADVLERLPPEAAAMRLAGDCPTELELAPCWSLPRNEPGERIRAELRQRDSAQGARWRSA